MKNQEPNPNISSEKPTAIVRLNGVKVGEVKDFKWNHQINDNPKFDPKDFSGQFEINLTKEERMALRFALAPQAPILFDIELPSSVISKIKEIMSENGMDYEPMFNGNKMVGVSISEKRNVWPTLGKPKWKDVIGNQDDISKRLDPIDWKAKNNELFGTFDHGPSPALLAYLEYERDAEAWDNSDKTRPNPNMMDYATAYRTTTREMKNQWKEQEHIMKDPDWESRFTLKNIRKEMFPPYDSKETFYKIDD